MPSPADAAGWEGWSQDPDPEWLEAYGASTFVGPLCDGAFVEYRIDGNVSYWVNTTTGEHSWNAPAEAAAEIAARDAALLAQRARGGSVAGARGAMGASLRSAGSNASRRSSGSQQASVEAAASAPQAPGGSPPPSLRKPRHKAGRDDHDDDEYAYEGLGPDFETNGPWVPPSIALAKAYREREVFSGGRASVWSTTTNDLAPLGSGVALYFKLLGTFSIMFGVLTALSIPSMVIFAAGMRTPLTSPDPLRFAHISLGNVGPVQYDTLATLSSAAGLYSSTVGAANATTLSQANLTALSVLVAAGGANASAACGALLGVAPPANYLTADPLDTLYLAPLPYFVVPFSSISLSGEFVAYLVAGLDFFSVLVVLSFAAYMSAHTENFVALVDRKKVSAANYTIYVTNLPKDATREEVRDHFSALFALDGFGLRTSGGFPQPDYKMLHSRHQAAHTYREAAIAADAQGSSPGASPAMAVTGGAVAAAMAAAVAEAEAAPPPPTGSIILDKEGAYVLTSTNMRTQPAPRDPRVLRTLALAAKKAAENRKKKGLVTEADPDVDFLHRLEALCRGTVAPPRRDPNTGRLPLFPRLEFVGSWVCDVHLVQPLRSLVKTYQEAQDLSTALHAARAKVKMLSKGTPLPEGPNERLREKALKSVGEAGSKLAALHERLARARKALTAAGKLAAARAAAAAGGDAMSANVRVDSSIGAAFVTFEHEESARRCIKAYEGSDSLFVRTFQAPHMRIRCPAAPGYHAGPDQSSCASTALVPYSLILEAHARGADVSGYLRAGRVVMDVNEGGSSIAWNAYSGDAWSVGGRGHSLCVMQAPDPSDVIHENLEVSAISRFLRQLMTTTVTVLIVIGGLLVMVYAQNQSTQLAGSSPDFSLCNTELPSLYFGASNVSAVQSALAAKLNSDVLAAKVGPSFATVALDPRLGSSLHVNDSAPLGRGRGRTLRFDTTSSLSNPLLSRSNSIPNRRSEDRDCPQGSFDISYRYDFPESAAAKFPGLPTAASVGLLPGASRRQPSSSSGSAVPYGLPIYSCDSRLQLSAISAADPGYESGLTPRVSEDPGCPDPRVILQPYNATTANVTGGYCPCIRASTSAMCNRLACYKPQSNTTKNVPAVQSTVQSIASICAAVTSVTSSAVAATPSPSASSATATVSEGTCSSTFPASTLIGCYCYNVLGLYASVKGSIAGFLAFSEKESDACSTFIGNYAWAEGLLVIAGAAATLVNLLLIFVIPWLAQLEAHTSLSSLHRAQALKLAAAQTINTSFVALLVNAHLPVDSLVLPDAVIKLGILTGKFGDFVTPWFAVVGTTIASTAIVNTLVPPLIMLTEFLSDSYSQMRAKRQVGYIATQEDLDELFVGARFNASSRYPLILTMTSVALLYSTGIPLLQPLACVGFLLQYMVDKAMLLKFYRKPPAYDASMARIAIRFLPYAALAHCAFALWMLSTPNSLPAPMLTAEWMSSLAANVGLSPTGTTVKTAMSAINDFATAFQKIDGVGALPRIMHVHTFPFFLLLIVVGILLIGVQVLRSLLVLLYAFISTITCSFVCCSSCKRCTFSCSRHDRRMALAIMSRVVRAGTGVHAQRVPLPTAAGGGTPKPGAPRPVGWVLASHLRDFAAIWPASQTLGDVARGLFFEALFVRSLRSDFEAEAASGLKVNLAGDTTGTGQGLAPFSGEFSRLFDVAKSGTTLSALEIQQGWRLQELDSRTLEDVNADASAFQFTALRSALTMGVAPIGTAELLGPELPAPGAPVGRGKAALPSASALIKAKHAYRGAAVLAMSPAERDAELNAAALQAAQRAGLTGGQNNDYEADEAAQAAMMAAVMEDAAAADKDAEMEAEKAAREARRGLGLLQRTRGLGTANVVSAALLTFSISGRQTVASKKSSAARQVISPVAAERWKRAGEWAVEEAVLTSAAALTAAQEAAAATGGDSSQSAVAADNSDPVSDTREDRVKAARRLLSLAKATRVRAGAAAITAAAATAGNTAASASAFAGTGVRRPPSAGRRSARVAPAVFIEAARDTDPDPSNSDLIAAAQVSSAANAESGGSVGNQRAIASRAQNVRFSEDAPAVAQRVPPLPRSTRSVAPSASGAGGGLTRFKDEEARPLTYVLRKFWNSESKATAAPSAGAPKSAAAKAAAAAALEFPPGVRRRRGRAKRTWEVIAETGIASYSLGRNPQYKQALAAAAEADMEARLQKAAARKEAKKGESYLDGDTLSEDSEDSDEGGEHAHGEHGDDDDGSDDWSESEEEE